jgi:hypothetical protein
MKVEKLKIPRLKKRHSELFDPSGVFKPKVMPSKKPYKRRAKHQKRDE